MMGMPYGISDAHCNLDISPDALYGFFVKIAILAGKVIDMTQSPREQSFSTALDLDQEIEDVANSMSADFWNTPAAPLDLSVGGATDWQELILSQICFHQLRVFLHMPFMLKSAENPRFEFSRKTCLDNSREMLRLYHMVRTYTDIKYECKAVDFIGFTACILLIIGLMGYGKLGASQLNDQQEADDWRMIDMSMEIFKQAATEKGGKVALQSYQVLRQMSKVRNQECQLPADPDLSSKFVIPCKFSIFFMYLDAS